MQVEPKNSSGNYTENDLNEYLLVLQPDAAVQEKLWEEKQRFAGDYDQDAAIHTQPQIVVAAFQAREEMEETLMRWIQRACDQHPQFVVTFNNYSGFPPHIIYIRVQEPRPIVELGLQLKAIDDWIQSSACPPLQLMRRPHLSLTKPLPESIYTRAMFSYAHKTFHESFMATEVRLLRKTHRYDTGRTIHVFPLARNSQRQEVA